MMTKLKFIILIVVATLFAAGCKSRKNVKNTTVEKEKISGVDSVFAAMKSAEFDFETLKGKFSGVYSFDTKKQGFSGQFRIRKDSLIWCSITVMNIEVARAIVTPDTVKLLNRLGKKYFITTIDYLNQKLNTDLDFDMLQALLLGNDIPYYETDKFQLETNNNFYILSTVGRGKLKEYIRNNDDLSKVLVQRMKIDKSTYRIVRQNIKQLRNPNKKLIATYSDFENHNGLFPLTVKFQFIGVKNILVDFQFNKIEKDIPLKYPFRVSKKYEVIRK